jgi:hypothetical protein
MRHEINFIVEKETKGAVRYKEVDIEGTDAFAPVVATLYVRKSAMPGGVIPPKLKVTISE